MGVPLFTCYPTEISELCPREPRHVSAEAEPDHVDIVEGQAEVRVQTPEEHGQLFADEARVGCRPDVVGNQGARFPVDANDVAFLLQHATKIVGSNTAGNMDIPHRSSPICGLENAIWTNP